MTVPNAAAAASGGTIRIRLDDPILRECTGRGILVAVIDSGARAPHPHLPRVSGGARVFVDASGTRLQVSEGDFLDTLGHGTAVAAAIHEKAPDAALLAVKVFGDRLTTSAAVLAHAIDYAVRRGARIVNLSLGTEGDHPELRDAVRRAAAQGARVVSALEKDRRPCYPGAFRDDVVAVLAVADCGRDELLVGLEGGHPVVRASPYPRPIPGVPAERNLSGVSFAVANTSGFLARLLEADRTGSADVLRRLAGA